MGTELNDFDSIAKDKKKGKTNIEPDEATEEIEKSKSTKVKENGIKPVETLRATFSDSDDDMPMPVPAGNDSDDGDSRPSSAMSGRKSKGGESGEKENLDKSEMGKSKKSKSREKDTNEHTEKEK